MSLLSTLHKSSLDLIITPRERLLLSAFSGVKKIKAQINGGPLSWSPAGKEQRQDLNPGLRNAKSEALTYHHPRQVARIPPLTGSTGVSALGCHPTVGSLALRGQEAAFCFVNSRLISLAKSPCSSQAILQDFAVFCSCLTCLIGAAFFWWKT